MQVIELDTSNRSHVNRFIDVPFQLYKDNPTWVPALVDDTKRQMDRKRNPFYQANDAAFFLAERDGRDVGRVCVMHPRYYNEFKNVSQGWFYLFESIDDQEVANALLNAAVEWARARGATMFRGPLGFMAADGFGMLAEGFEHRPAIGIPYNFDYYPRLVENWGFELEERVYSGYLDLVRLRANFPQKILDVAEKIKQRYGFTIKIFKSKNELRTWVAPRLAALYNKALTHIAGDPPLRQEEVDAVAENLMLIADPKLLKFVMKGDEIIGFLFCFVDISEGIKQARGRLFPFGWLPILLDFRRTTWVNLNGMGMLPEYHGLGGPALLYAELYKTIEEFGNFQHADVVQISEFNVKSLNEMAKFGMEYYKTHHIYCKSL
jgi:GNAT superfamily N-acetyltransferase